MSVQTEIDRIITAVGAAYDAVEAKGGTAPAAQTIEGLAAAVGTIQTGIALQLIVTVSAGATVTATNGSKRSEEHLTAPAFVRLSFRRSAHGAYLRHWMGNVRHKIRIYHGQLRGVA